MITLLFFAKLREELGTASLQFEFTGSVAELKAQLAQRGPQWAAALSQDNLRCAVNQAVASEQQMIAAGDEVAFFPPVTGG
mgnify:CR=1 FL=1